MVKKSKKAKYNKKYFKKFRKTNKHINKKFRKKYTKKRGGTNEPSRRRDTPNRVRSKKKNKEQLFYETAFLRGMDRFEQNKSNVETPGKHRREYMSRLNTARIKAIEENERVETDRQKDIDRQLEESQKRIDTLGRNTDKRVSKAIEKDKIAETVKQKYHDDQVEKEVSTMHIRSENAEKKVSDRKPPEKPFTHKDDIKYKAERAATKFMDKDK